MGECVYDFEALSESELNLKVGDIVDITDRSDPEWWFGTCKRTNQSGYFPKNYVKKYRAPENQSPLNGSNNNTNTNETVKTSNAKPIIQPNNENNNTGSKPLVNSTPNVSVNSTSPPSSSSPPPNKSTLSQSTDNSIKLKMNLVSLPKNDKNMQNSKSKGFFSNLFSKKKSKKHTPFFSLKYVFS